MVEIGGSFQELITSTVQTVEGFWKGYFQLVNVRRNNIRLKKQIDALQMENRRYEELLASRGRLEELLAYKEQIDQPVVAAQVVGRDPTGWFKSIILDKGKDAGLRPDMPVVNASGVVGKVVSVSKGFAKALLIIDQNSCVDSLVQRTRDRGMVKGLSARVCNFDYVVKSSDIKVGDRIVSSGLGGVFPKGLAIGRVIGVDKSPGDLFKEVRVEPVVDFSKLEEVLVILRRSRYQSLQ